MNDPEKRISDLALLHPEVRQKVIRCQQILDDEDIPLRVFESFRIPERQNYLYAQGRTRPGRKVTFKEAWGSYHQYGLAVDFVFFENNEWNWGPDGSKKHQRWYQRLHDIGDSLGLEHLDFETPHLQLAGWSSAKLLDGQLPPSGDAAWFDNLLKTAQAWTGSPKAPRFDDFKVTEPKRPPLEEVIQVPGNVPSIRDATGDSSGVPSGAEKNLKSRLFAGNAALEAVLSGHRVLRASGGKIEGVELLQKALNELSQQHPAYAIEPDGFSGYFGQKTERAVRAFQEDYRLVIDGKVGEETIEALDTAMVSFEKNPAPVGRLSAGVNGSGYRPLPINGRLLAGVKFENADESAGKTLREVYAAADRDPSLSKGDPSNCKALLKFPDGTVFFDAKMAICADGSPRAKEIDPGPGNPETAFTYPGSKGAYFDAENVPYLVLPGQNKSGTVDFIKTMGISPLDLAVIVNQGKITPAFYGEVGPWFRLGEASIEVHENLPVRTPWTSTSKVKVRNASVEGDVLCFIFPNTAVKKATGMSNPEWLAATLVAASQCWEKFLANQ